MTTFLAFILIVVYIYIKLLPSWISFNPCKLSILIPKMPIIVELAIIKKIEVNLAYNIINFKVQLKIQFCLLKINECSPKIIKCSHNNSVFLA